jgi:CIC family chloride channel protein
MIVASISFAISKRFERHSMDVKELAKKGMPLLVIKTRTLATLDTSSIIQTDYLTVTPGENLEN